MKSKQRTYDTNKCRKNNVLLAHLNGELQLDGQLSKIAEIADVSVSEVIVAIIEDFLTNLEIEPEALVGNAVVQYLITTRLFPSREQAKAAAARYNDLVDKFGELRFHDCSRASVIEAVPANSQEIAGYWVTFKQAAGQFGEAVPQLSVRKEVA